jgi:hypothetical protein
MSTALYYNLSCIYKPATPLLSTTHLHITEQILLFFYLQGAEKHYIHVYIKSCTRSHYRPPISYICEAWTISFFLFLIKLLINNKARWLRFLTGIWEFAVSNLFGQRLHWRTFSGCSQLLQELAVVVSHSATSAFFYTVCILLFIDHPIIRSCIVIW